MDIRAKIVLDLVKSIKGAENSVIAGGAVRDLLFDVPPKDVDIFVPHKVIKEVKKEVQKLDKEMVPKGEEYGTLSLSTLSKRYLKSDSGFECYGFKFEDVQFDLITSYYLNDEQFGENLIEDFDYGLNMVFYDGLSINDTNDEFKRDFLNRRMTLRKINSVDDLPKMIMKYNNICLRYKEAQGWSPGFNSSCLTLKKVKKEKNIKSIYDDVEELIQHEIHAAGGALLGGAHAHRLDQMAGMMPPMAGRFNRVDREDAQNVFLNEPDVELDLGRAEIQVNRADDF